MTAPIKRDRPIVDQTGRLTQYGWGIMQSLWRATGGAQEADGTELKATVLHVPHDPGSQDVDPSPLPSMGEPDRTDPVPRAAVPDIISNLTILEKLEHEGSSLGFFGAPVVSQQTAPVNLTDNTGGSTDGTVENVPSVSGDSGGSASVSAAANVATVSSVNTAISAIENNLAELTKEVNQIRTVFINLGLAS